MILYPTQERPRHSGGLLLWEGKWQVNRFLRNLNTKSTEQAQFFNAVAHLAAKVPAAGTTGTAVAP
jgi:hypothetical protein